jgi:hypothetical protein
MKVAQRRWEGAMEVQLQRLRAAAHQAEDRNAAATAAANAAAVTGTNFNKLNAVVAAAAGGNCSNPSATATNAAANAAAANAAVGFAGGSSGHSSGTEREQREAAVAARLSHLQERVGEMLLAESERVDLVDEHVAAGSHGGKPLRGGRAGNSADNRGGGGRGRGGGPGLRARPDTALERGVNQLSAPNGLGQPPQKGERAPAPSTSPSPGMEELAEVRSLCNMVRAAGPYPKL